MTDSRKFASVPTLRTGHAHPHPEPIGGAHSAVELMPGFRVVLLDQRKLPQQERHEFYTRPNEVADAIRAMVVRGAPAIGITAAYGVVAGAMHAPRDEQGFRAAMKEADAVLRAARPTAVNIAWALDRMRKVVEECATLEAAPRVERLATEARAIHREDVAACKSIGARALDLDLVPDGATILTHCNAGALATGGYGTALGVVRAAHAAGKKIRVLACETRPYLQGARLTAWELAKDGIAVEVIADAMAAHFMSKREIDLVVVGADRIAKNGDVANKIGTYSHACIAAAHDVPFFVAAPWSTVDLACPSGAEIPIEERPEEELSHFKLPDGNAISLVPDGVHVRNPAFDVTPAHLVTAILTERGVARPASEISMLR
ncbi:MAG TPA: S-methyl-5-thioribose-1-phosphate isomerase [Labilithrix sp.]|jgi:methylthioribose-1-phosphate isomerase